VHALGLIEECGWAQTRLIDDLLDISRLINGRLQMDFQVVELVELCSNALDSIMPTVGQKPLTLHRKLASPPLRMRGDPLRLKQVLWNLLTNAVKFTPRGSITVDLQTFEATEEEFQPLVDGDSLQGSPLIPPRGREGVRPYARLCVSDTGIGIDPASMPLLFRRFGQLDTGLRRQHSGLGLGLSIAKSIVELHGGSIEASSDGLGRGTSFAVVLPLLVPPRPPPDQVLSAAVGSSTLAGVARGAPTARSAAEDRKASATGVGDSAAATAQATTKPAEPPKRLTGARVMVVDDDGTSLRLMKSVLERYGAEVRTYSGGESALQAMVADPDWHNCILSDVSMPVMSGFDFLAAVRAMQPTMPVIAVTAHTGHADQARIAAAGFSGYVAKPLRSQTLVDAVDGTCVRPRISDDEHSQP
jgi:CheY-like chemotaxis protein